MLELRYVVDNLEAVRAGLGRRSKQAAASLDAIAELAQRRSAVITEVESLRHEQNEANQAMAKLDKKSAEFAERRDTLRRLSQRAKELKTEQDAVEAELEQTLLSVPNIPLADAPDGSDESHNVMVREGGQKPSFDFAPKDHADLGSALGIMDFARAAKISGARFTVLRGAGARLERALMAFMLDLHSSEHGYTEIWPPALVLSSAMRGTGQLPKFAADSFRIASDWEAPAHDEKDAAPPREFYLVPTAEVPVTNLHADEILEAEQLPIKYCAYTPCFRSEAGSYGKDTRGMFRQHQFDKVELVRFERPEDAAEALEQLTRDAEAVLRKLDLHYRVMSMCAGDMGPSAQRAYDVEVWLPGQDQYREISSCSWFGDYQARRAKIRYRPARGEKPRLLHTLNGSGLAIGRTLIAILEQNQQADGSVRVPSALVPYMGGLELLK